MGKRDTKEEQEKRERRLLEEHVRKRNAEIVPEKPGFVRTTGSSRQYRHEIRSDETLVAIEI